MIRRIGAALGLAVSLWLCPAGPATAYLDLSQASVERLENGLTVIVLEEHSFPVVSVQMLYRTGARDELTGKTGLAHFVEHMAFRHSEDFPDFGLTGAITAVGGEWHGYSWLDQTTYFATAPAAQLELLLRIEAQRMSKVRFDAADIEAERGAVLTELYGYENDPGSLLHDHVLYLSFLAHPYRNNAIGWDSDVAHIGYGDVLEFYTRQYQPGNAVLAVVGDVSRDEVMRLVTREFAQLPGKARTPRPHTVEPLQNGERRIRLAGAPARKYFQIAYRAPAVHSPDFAAFLLVQDLLAGGSGINFLENDWGTPARAGAMLSGVSEDVSTWFPPLDQDYLFAIKGSLPGDADESQTENAVEDAIARLRKQFSTEEESARNVLMEAVARVNRALVLDLRTTEDAAHQLGYFAGIDALHVLIGLPGLLEEVRPADIVRIIDSWLRPEQRTIGWLVPGQAARARPITEPASESSPAQPVLPMADHSRSAAERTAQAQAAVMSRLANGTPVIMQRSTLSPAVTLRVVTQTAQFELPDGVNEQQPAVGLAALDFELLPAELDHAVARARKLVDSAGPVDPHGVSAGHGPDALLEQAFNEALGIQPVKTKPAGPVLLVITGDVDPEAAQHSLEKYFADLPASHWNLPAAKVPEIPAELEKRLRFPVAQEALGYLAWVPEPSVMTSLAWQMALNILVNGHGGRLGTAAIGRRGLVYWIDSAYQTDGRNQWITFSTGVDPRNHAAMKEVLKQQLARLLTEPPSQQEFRNARSHMLGRFLSEAQSNAELADFLTRQWILYGKLLGYEEYERLLNRVSRKELVEHLQAFTQGVVVSVRNPPPD